VGVVNVDVRWLGMAGEGGTQYLPHG